MPYTNKPSRREFLAWSALAAGAGSCRAPQPPAPSPRLSSNELIELSATDAVRAMREGELNAEDYAAALLERCEAGKHLNAFITLDANGVLEAARAADRRRAAGGAMGPLHGLPMPIKDSVNTQDFPTPGGTPALRDFTPKEDAPVIRTLREAGAIVMGKTNLHELSWGWSSNNLAFGAVRNPYDPTRIVHLIADKLSVYKNITTKVSYPRTEGGRPHLQIVWDKSLTPLTVEQAQKELERGEPSIRTCYLALSDGELEVGAAMLKDDEIDVLVPKDWGGRRV